MDSDVVKVESPGVGKVIERLLGSTIGLKAVMALTGLMLVGFVLVHMLGHLQMFGPKASAQEAYNAYAHTLQSLGGLKWAARLGLLGATALHIWAALKLLARNNAARPTAYAEQKWLAASVAARTMRVTGPIVLFFIIYHLLHFTLLAVSTAGFPEVEYVLTQGALAGTKVPDAYGRMLVSFQQPLIAVIYVVSVALLGGHLAHGIQSTLQTLGLNNSTYRPLVRSAGPLLAAVIVVGFISVPIAILAGVIGK
jgi:succinate dehydrogenase / fumarate reductase cytochrome b subunit